jgi:hypothetical protein
MVKPTIQKAGVRRVCPRCGSSDVQLDINQIGGVCNACRARSERMLELSYMEMLHYSRDLKAKDKMKRFSLLYCDEVEALMFLLLFVVFMLVFIAIIKSRWGLW